MRKDLIEKYGCEVITSRANARITAYSKLSDKKFRDGQKQFLAEGVKLTEEALLYASVSALLISESAAEREETESLIASAHAKRAEIVILSESVFDKVSTESAPQGVISVLRYPDNKGLDFSTWQSGKRLIMLTEIRDPGNLGTVLRGAESLGMNGVILDRCADIYNSKTVRASMGSVFRVPAFVTCDGKKCISDLKAAGRRVFAASLGENDLVLGKYETKFSDCIVIGNEGHGISDGIKNECSCCVRIPMTGKAESMNAAMAATCIMWEYQRNTAEKA